MELSRAIATMAVILGVVLAAGFAAGEDSTALEKKAEAERACHEPLQSEKERAACRAAKRAL